MGRHTTLVSDAVSQAGLANELDGCDLKLIREAVLGAVAENDDFDIEQMVRRRNAQPVRRRVRARIERNAEKAISALVIDVERDGEPVANWSLPAENERLAIDGVASATEAIDAFTAVLLQAEAARRHVARGNVEQASAAVDRVLHNARRAWRQVGLLCRDRALDGNAFGAI